MEDSSPDLVAVEGCRSRLTPAKSDQSSALTVGASTDSLARNANATLGQPIKWTDKKHSLYLGDLEASFVNQLRGLTNSIRTLPSKTCNSSDQFTVLHGGLWKKKNYERNESSLNPAADSHVLLENPWICHYRSPGKRRVVTSSYVKERSTPSSEGFHFGKRTSSLGLETCPEKLHARHSCRQDSVGSITEVSDQNFEDENQVKNPSSPSMAKRFKVDAADASSNDQVVPSRKLSTTEVITTENTSTKREDCVNHHGISPDPDSFVRPKSDVHHFFKGS